MLLGCEGEVQNLEEIEKIQGKDKLIVWFFVHESY